MYFFDNSILSNKNPNDKTIIHFTWKKIHEVKQKRLIKISAQAHLEKFYTDHGFKKTSNIYLEDGIPHISMILE